MGIAEAGAGVLAKITCTLIRKNILKFYNTPNKNQLSCKFRQLVQNLIRLNQQKMARLNLEVVLFGVALAVIISPTTSASNQAKCLQCITRDASFSKEKASCVTPLECVMPGQCFKAVFEGGLTIRGCPLGNEPNMEAKICDKIKGLMTSSSASPSLKTKFNNDVIQKNFKASCGGGGAKPQVFFCRGPSCNRASPLKGGPAVWIAIALVVTVASLFK